jgi:predicted RNA-binding protein YlxR (DUF448 family)
MAPPIHHVPERMCLGCGNRAPKHELVRFGAVRGEDGLMLVRDADGRLGGRGLYTCPSQECFERAAGRRGFSRGARAAVTVDAALANGLGDGQVTRRA